MKVRFWTHFGLTLMGLVAAAAEPMVTADLSDHDAWLGDPVTLTVHVHFDDTWEIGLVELADRVGPMHVLSQTWSEPRRDPETQLNELEFQARVAWYRLGDFVVAPIAIRATPVQGPPIQIRTPELKISIAPMLQAEDSDWAPPKGQLSIPGSTSVAVIVLAVFLLLGTVAALVLWFRWTKTPKPKPVDPRLPPIEEALASLKALTHGSLLKEGRTKPFYVEINGIIHLLYARLFGIPALELTGTEIAAFLEEAQMDASFRAVNAAFQQACDAVKFARYLPSQAEITEVVNWAHQIIDFLAADHETIREAGHVAVG